MAGWDGDKWVTEVTDLMLTEFDGRAKFGKFRRMLYQRNLVKCGISRVLKRLSSSSRFLVFEKDGHVKHVSVCWEDVDICCGYRKKGWDTCQKYNCPKFHVCKFFIAGNCTKGSRCLFGHDLENETNENVSYRLGMSSFSADEIRTIIFRSKPAVCVRHNMGGCQDEHCPALHVCGLFVQNKCTSGYNCQFGHVLQSSEHSQWVLNTFDLEDFTDEELRKRILVRGVSTADRGLLSQMTPAISSLSLFSCTTAVSSTSSIATDDTDEYILPNVTSQPVRNSPKPADSVKRQPEINPACSAASCEPARKTDLVQDLSKLNEVKDAKLGGYDYICKSFTWTGVCSNGPNCQYYHSPDRLPYQWMIHNQEDGVWNTLPLHLNVEIEETFCEPSDRHSLEGTLQYILEEKYLKGQHKYYFEFEELRLMINTHGSRMVQENLDTQRTARILRRPVFVNESKPPAMSPLLLGSIPEPLPHKVPDHWSSVDHFQDFEVVELKSDETEFAAVHERFFSTMDIRHHKIVHVFRVQNPGLWDKYCSARRAMTPRGQRPEDVDERQLFHGTPTLQSARGICANSFDFRRAGENVGAIHGRGAYFSTTADYSHNYTRPHERVNGDPLRFMFLGKILVGQYTLGHLSYSKPPVREGLKLYDSCVDNMITPSIFVIFDLAQSYPEYWVQYTDVSDIDDKIRTQSQKTQARSVAATNLTQTFAVPTTTVSTSLFSNSYGRSTTTQPTVRNQTTSSLQPASGVVNQFLPSAALKTSMSAAVKQVSTSGAANQFSSAAANQPSASAVAQPLSTSEMVKKASLSALQHSTSAAAQQLPKSKIVEKGPLSAQQPSQSVAAVQVSTSEMDKKVSLSARQPSPSAASQKLSPSKIVEKVSLSAHQASTTAAAQQLPTSKTVEKVSLSAQPPSTSVAAAQMRISEMVKKFSLSAQEASTSAAVHQRPTSKIVKNIPLSAHQHSTSAAGQQLSTSKTVEKVSLSAHQASTSVTAAQVNISEMVKKFSLSSQEASTSVTAAQQRPTSTIVEKFPLSAHQHSTSATARVSISEMVKKFSL